MVGDKIMKYPIKIVDNLPFIKLKINYRGNNMILENVLIDTGSAKSILKEGMVKRIGIKPEPDDVLGSIRGVGGTEFVYIKQVDSIAIGEIQVEKFKVDIGEMDYGFDIDGIIGMDFLIETNSIIDLHNLLIMTG
ncbi:MAG: retropepsin-like aspartic protease [Halanaerobiaceae bacterium]